jgi:hypothetical protein
MPGVPVTQRQAVADAALAAATAIGGTTANDVIDTLVARVFNGFPCVLVPPSKNPEAESRLVREIR